MSDLCDMIATQVGVAVRARRPELLNPLGSALAKQSPEDVYEAALQMVEALRVACDELALADLKVALASQVARDLVQAGQGIEKRAEAIRVIANAQTMEELDEYRR